METAGKFVEDETLREALKENGIGRPSTRAAIIETLYKRNYIRKERKNLIATATGKELIATIKDDLLKSAELTGIWENKLRKIESDEYSGKRFIEELKEMVNVIVANVKSERGAKISIESVPADKSKPNKKGVKKEPVKSTETKGIADTAPICPVCKKGKIIKGKKAYGCSRWDKGCRFVIPFEVCPPDASAEMLKNAIVGIAAKSNV